MTEKEKSGHSLPASGVHALDGCKEHHGNNIITHKRKVFCFTPEELEAEPMLRKWQGKPIYSVQELKSMYDDRGIPYIMNITPITEPIDIDWINAVILKRW